MRPLLVPLLVLLMTASGLGYWLLVPGRAPVLQVPASAEILLSVKPLKRFSRLQSQLLMTVAGVKGADPNGDIDTYAVTYKSSGRLGDDIILSGLLALPSNRKIRGITSWQHGTTSSAERVPSRLSLDGLAASVFVAGRGDMLIAPDYSGLGDSKDLSHPYLIKEAVVRSVSDFLAAAEELEIGPTKRPPFLIGFSQGAHASLATHEFMEQNGKGVLGTAAIAGGNNLRSVSFDFALSGSSPHASLYLGLLAAGYADYYDEDLSELIREPFRNLMPGLLLSDQSAEEVRRKLPSNPRHLFTEKFLDAFANNERHWFLQKLRENETSHWSPKAPVRLYYGEWDKDVSPEDAQRTFALMKERGGNVSIVNIGRVDHDGTALGAIPDIVSWYENKLLN